MFNSSLAKRRSVSENFATLKHSYVLLSEKQRYEHPNVEKPLVRLAISLYHKRKKVATLQSRENTLTSHIFAR